MSIPIAPGVGHFALATGRLLSLHLESIGASMASTMLSRANENLGFGL
jgi:hypothetical protein